MDTNTVQSKITLSPNVQHITAKLSAGNPAANTDIKVFKSADLAPKQKTASKNKVNTQI